MEAQPLTAQGRFVWFDLMTPDPQRAMPFYHAVTGWNTEEWTGTSDAPYTMWITFSGPIGGFDTSSSDGPPFWIGYIEYGDFDATLQHAEALGAR